MQRRAFLKNSMKGLLAASTPIGGPKSFALAGSNKPYVLRIHCDGGWDQTCVFDNKLDSTVVAFDPGSSIGTGSDGITYISHGSRPSVDSFFAIHGGQACIVNGLYCHGISRNQTLPLSMGMPVEDKTTYIRDFLDYYAELTAPNKIAPYLVFNSPYFPGETAGNSFLINELTRNKYTTSPSGMNILNNTADEEIASFLDNQYKLFTKGLKKNGIDYRKADAIAQSRDSLDEFRQAFSDAETATQNAGDSSLLADAKVALQLFKNGTSQAATVQSGRQLEWDTVANNFLTQNILFENLFSDLIAIIAFAETLGISENLIIYVTSECGRAPTLNTNNGKNRWSYTSMLAWGKYIRPATVAGRTDEYLRGVNMDPIFGSEEDERNPLNIRHAFAALYFAMGLNYGRFLPGVDYLSLMIKLR